MQCRLRSKGPQPASPRRGLAAERQVRWADMAEEDRPWMETRAIIDLVRHMELGSAASSFHCRRALCATCGVETWQVRHGYSLSGRLWKGHACACGAWHCTECDTLHSRAVQCC